MNILLRAFSKIEWHDVAAVIIMIVTLTFCYVAFLPDVPGHLPRVRP